MHVLRVNETKITSRNALIDNLSALEKKNTQRMTKGPSSRTGYRFLICLVTFKLQMPQICGFLD